MPKVGVKQIRKAQIINATLECIAAVGLENLTIDAIIKNAEFSKGIVMYYFKTKKELLLQSFSAFLDYFHQRILAHISHDMEIIEIFYLIINLTLSPLERRVRKRRKTIKLNNKNSIIICLSMKKQVKLFAQFYSKAILDKDFQKIIQAKYKVYHDSLVRIIEYGIEKKKCGKINASEGAISFMALLEGVVTHYLIGFRPVNVNALRHICKKQVQRILS